MTTIFHPYGLTLDGSLIRPADQAPCWQGLHQVEEECGMRVVHWPNRALHDYYAGLQWVWGTDNVLIVEHDVELLPHQVKELSECPAGLCAFGCLDRLDGPDWVHWHSEGGTLRQGAEGDRWATIVGSTNLLISRKVQETVRVPVVTWQNMGGMLREEIRKQGWRFHLHWPAVRHFHTHAQDRAA